MSNKKIKSPDNPKNLLHSSISGALGGGIEGVIGFFLNELKIQKQSFGKYTLMPSTLYHGAGMASFTMAITISIRLTVNDLLVYQFTIDDAESKNNMLYKCPCAFLGGMSSSPFLSPIELTATLQQKISTSMKVTFRQAMMNLVDQRGYSRLSVGTGAVALRDGCVTTNLLFITPLLKQYYSQSGHLSETTSQLAAGISGGLIAYITSQPFEMLKFIKQTKCSDAALVKYAHIAKQVYTEKGFAGFYSGSAWRGARLIVGITMLSFVVPRIKSKLEQTKTNPHGFFSINDRADSRNKAVFDVKIDEQKKYKK